MMCVEHLLPYMLKVQDESVNYFTIKLLTMSNSLPADFTTAKEARLYARFVTLRSQLSCYSHVCPDYLLGSIKKGSKQGLIHTQRDTTLMASD